MSSVGFEQGIFFGSGWDPIKQKGPAYLPSLKDGWGETGPTWALEDILVPDSNDEFGEQRSGSEASKLVHEFNGQRYWGWEGSVLVCEFGGQRLEKRNHRFILSSSINFSPVVLVTGCRWHWWGLLFQRREQRLKRFASLCAPAKLCPGYSYTFFLPWGTLCGSRLVWADPLGVKLPLQGGHVATERLFRTLLGPLV